ncbi:MAG: S8 family serine peptidase [Gammaproteobacteria bacterium]|nr:S8 family serine peptidase [Gammaproteobacteria bacterium]MCP4276190.1 S8 family serine peptidase [Gammaproteobacteria bacterium]MCP4930012.1 S8 family serine peptidase [Gammaproteobacteria bacterium]
MLVISCGGGGGGGGGGSGGEIHSAAYECTAIGDGSLYSIGGNISVAPGSILDSDTPYSVTALNGSFDSPQAIPSQVTIGGFANAGSSSIPADTNDFFEVELTEGDNIVLQVADAIWNTNDLDLYLYNSNRELVGLSEYGESIEALVAPDDGLFFIEVRVWKGSSSYILTVDGGIQGAAKVTNSLTAEFVPGEIIVQYEQVEQTVSTVNASSLGVSHLQHIAGAPGRPMRMRMAATFSASALSDGDAPESQMQFRSEEERRKYETLLELKRLRHDPIVKYASLNYIRYPLRMPDDPDYSAQWHYDLIDLPLAWDLTTGSPGVVVAVIDTGIKSEHSDLKNKLVDGYDFVSDRSNAGDGDTIDDDPDDPGGASFHGTHVAGTVAADTDNAIGGAGVAWDTSIMPLRALGLNGGTFYDIMQAMLYAAGLPNDSGLLPTKRADVINLSLGGPLPSPDPFEQSVINQVREQGVIVIAAAGNQSSSFPFYPASYDGVTSVSAVTKPIIGEEPELAEYSSFGPGIDLAAPGGADAYKIYSTWWNDKDGQESYAVLQGTSMATPHVAGVVALMQSARIAAGQDPLTPNEFDQLVEAGSLSTDLGSLGRDDQFGYGLINAEQAVQAALNFSLVPLPPQLAVTPAVIDFRADLNTSGITLSNIGDGELNILSISEVMDMPWLDIEPSASVGPDGLGFYLLHVDRTGLAEGEYTAEILINSSANTINIPLNMTVSNNAFAGEVGDINVLLFNAELFYNSAEFALVAEQIVSSTNGSYAFDDIASACYLVVATTDIDKDFRVFDLGEAWGGFTNKSDATPLVLDADIENIDFEVAFDQLQAVPTSIEHDMLSTGQLHFGGY